MNQIEVAERIIEQNGKCSDIACEDCPAYPIQLKVSLRSCNEIWGADDDKKCKDWFKNWLKKQEEKNMSDKIQMTEEQAEKMMFDCFDFEQGWEKTKSNLRKKGYIIKSELQQKVEEAKRMWDTKTYWTPLEHIQREAIELLEQSHPEFKEK